MRDVLGARGGRAQPVVLLARGLGLTQPQGEQRSGGEQERGRVEDRHRAAARDGVEPGARDRRDEPQPFADGLQRRVGRRQQLRRKQRHEQRGLARGEHHVGRAIQGRNDIDDPYVARVADEQQREHGERRERVDDEQQRAAAHPVHEQPAERREQLRRDDAQEHEPGRGARAGELLHPQPEREPQRRVTEQAERLADEEQPRVPVREQAPHTR